MHKPSHGSYGQRVPLDVSVGNGVVAFLEASFRYDVVQIRSWGFPKTIKTSIQSDLLMT